MDSLKEKVLHTDVVFQGRFLKVRRDQVETPSGAIQHREYILHPGAAMIIPVFDNGDLLLIKQYRHAVKQVFYEFPAGKKDPGENTFVTAQRELSEETGATSNDWSYLTRIHPVIGYSDEFIDFYLAENIQVGTAHPDDGEIIEPERLSLGEAMKLVSEGKVTDVKTSLGLFWYEKVMKKEWPKLPADAKTF